MTPDLRQLWKALVSAGIEQKPFSALTEEEIIALCNAVVEIVNGKRLEEIDRHLKRIADNPAQLPAVEACQVRALGRFREELSSVEMVLECEKQVKE